MISILCPTRNRSIQYRRMVNSLKATTATPVSVLSGTNGNDDYALKQYPVDMPTVHMWNDLARIAYDSGAKLFMLGADDIVFTTPLWDEAIIDHYNKLENKVHVYALQDSRDNLGTPHPIVTREYIDALGYFIPPIFMHWFCDSWTVEIAKANKCFTHLKDFLLVHDKPSDRGQADETHTRIRRNGWYERDKRIDETCKHFLAFEMQRLAEAMS